MLLFISFTLNVFVSCKNPKEPDGFIFLNTLWTLESIEANGEIIRPPSDQIYNVQFYEDGTFTGRNDCNDIQGEYKLIGNQGLEIEHFGGTKVFCIDSIDNVFKDSLKGTNLYSIDSNKLRLDGAGSWLIFAGMA